MESNRKFARGLARAFAGAIIFAFPLMMTMEMWWLGFYMDRLHLLLFIAVSLVLLVPLSRCIGFEETHSWRQDVLDALTAFGIAILASATMLTVLGLVKFGMPAGEILGKIAIQAVPASIGAIVARGQLGGNGAGSASGKGQKPAQSSYSTELLLMTVGALFLAFNVAPTEEMILIAFKMRSWHALALILLSILALHAFVYVLDFRGQEQLDEGTSWWVGMLSFSVAGFGIAILVSLYIPRTFGRMDGASMSQIAMMVCVLGFPAALGAGSARLIV